MAKKMKSEAAKLGADAVIIARQSEETGAMLVPVGNMWIAGSLKEKKMVG